MAASGARAGTSKGGKRVLLSRTKVQKLGGGNWAKGVNTLRSGTAPLTRGEKARKAAESRDAGRILSNAMNSNR